MLSMNGTRTTLPVVVLAAILVGVQLLTHALGKEYYLTQMIMSAYYSMVVLGLCLVMGYAGQVSLGHAAFFALGGYTSALLTTKNFMAISGTGIGKTLLGLRVLIARPDLYGGRLVTMNPWAAFVLAMFVSCAAALLIGYPALRLKGHYLAMATLGFGLIVYRIVLGCEFLGSADGITGVPEWKICPGFVLGGRTEHRVANYYLAWGITLIVLMLLLNVVRSRVGRALRSIHEGELAANAMGIHTARLKLQTFVVSAALAAAAGCFLTHYNGGIGPSEAGAMKSVRYVALVAAGGMANLTGGLVVSSVLTFLSLRGCFGTYDHAVFGIILIVIVSLAPEGPLKPIADRFKALFTSDDIKIRKRSTNGAA
jgi:branched-chain amino acid transport system permease protein